MKAIVRSFQIVCVDANDSLLNDHFDVAHKVWTEIALMGSLVELREKTLIFRAKRSRL